MCSPRVAIAVGSALLAVSCSGPSSRSAAELSEGPAQAEPAPLPAPNLPPRDALDALAKRYASGLVPDAEPIEGQLAAGERRDFLAVLRYGFCYRILGASEEGFEDLDLALFDPMGVQITQDPGQDRYPVLGLHSDVCPAQAGAYRIQAHAYQGEGRFALRVYRTKQ